MPNSDSRKNHDNLVYSASNSKFANHKLEKKIDKRQKKIKISTI